MSKLPFGGFEIDSEHERDASWTKLKTIAEYLENGEALPPYLAQWLANAIDRSGEDPDEFLRLLELKNRPGRRRSKFTKKDEWSYGAKVCELEEDGLSPERAISAVLGSLHGEGPSRSQLQKWRDKYRRALEEADATK